MLSLEYMKKDTKKPKPVTMKDISEEDIDGAIEEIELDIIQDVDVKDLTQKQKVERLILAGCSEEEIAGRLNLLMTELAGLKGDFIKEDPDWTKRMEFKVEGMSAIAKEKLLDSLEHELKDSSSRPESAKFYLTSRAKEYNPKLIVDVKTESTEFTDEELKIIRSFFPKSEPVTMTVSNPVSPDTVTSSNLPTTQ